MHKPLYRKKKIMYNCVMTSVFVFLYSIIWTGFINTPAFFIERYCKYCLNQVENEKYFLLYCPLYNCIRESFQSIFKNSQNSTEDDLLLQIINPINPQDTKDICLFIKESFT